MDYGMAGIIIPYLLLTVNEASPFSSTVISLDEWTGNPQSSIPFFYSRARAWENKDPKNDSSYAHEDFTRFGDIIMSNVKNQSREPVFVTFFEGLMGPGWFVCGGNSSPCGWEWGVCFGGRTGFFMDLCGGCGRG